MQSRLLTGTEDLEKAFIKWSDLAENIRIVTAWATADCAVYKCLKDAHSKISTMVVGLDFYTTSPEFLDSFLSVVRIGSALRNGTFHPKLYLFELRDRFCCVMGSSNFTHGGFADNTELNICVEGRQSDRFYPQVSAFLDEQEKRSEIISAAEIADYAEQFERLRASRVRLAKFQPGAQAQAKSKTAKERETSGDAPPQQLNRTWPEFIAIILSATRRGRVIGNADDSGYLPTAEHCQHLFQIHGRLATMTVAERQFIGGTTAEGGWFGSMKGAGYFKQRLNDDPASLDLALDHIPPRGILRKPAFDAFADRYQWRQAGIGTASRLLSMKRPDLFICIDVKNRSGIARAFGVSASSLQTFEGYWELMQRIWRCPWWRAPRPQHELEGRVWRARVALLDSLYYEADS
jgi:HKD family nuclease